jgi:hypothetical protein
MVFEPNRPLEPLRSKCVEEPNFFGEDSRSIFIAVKIQVQRQTVEREISVYKENCEEEGAAEGTTMVWREEEETCLCEGLWCCLPKERRPLCRTATRQFCSILIFDLINFKRF